MALTNNLRRFANTARFFITGLPKYAVGSIDVTNRKLLRCGPREPKGKCMMGDNADCDRCGCVVPFHMATLSSRRLMLKEQFNSWRSQGASAG